MASPPAFASTKETVNFARLCRLLVDVGSQALRVTFDKIHPPAGLHKALLSPSVHTTLQSLYKGKKKVLNPTQWGNLYPAHGAVSSASFDITLLTVLLRNICGLITPVAGWDALPAATDLNIQDDIARVKYYRNNLYAHASQASIDDASFTALWQEIREALVRLGGASFGATIDNLETDSIDPDTEEHYRKLLQQWKKDDDSIKDKLEEIEEKIRGDLEQLKSEMKCEMENLSDKLKTLKASTGESKEQDPFDPAELIDSIRQLYKAREGRLSPFPWCEEFQFHLNDIFTRLKIVSREKTRGTETDKIIQMCDIFTPHDECPQPRVVLIEGDLGMGKTTYCSKLAYDWATKEKETDCFARFQVVLLLRCRDIKSDGLWEAIDDQLIPREVPEEEKEIFFEFIRRNQSKVLLVLDGLDQLPTSNPQVVYDIIKGRMLPNSHVVVTARHEAGKTVRCWCDTLLRIKGFTEEDARKFIVKYFKTMEELSQKLLHKLRQDRHLQKMTVNPLNVALLCLLCEDFKGIFPQNRTELYLELVQCVLRRYRIKKGLPETKEDLIKVHNAELYRLGLIALNGLREDSMSFEDSAFGIHSGDISEFGFLSFQPGSSKRKPCVYYGFQHKSFQELFAGFSLSCQLIAKDISPESLVSDKRYFRDLKQVLLFTCGILATQCKETAMALIKAITAEVNKGHDDHFLVALECINECKKEQSDLHMTLAEVLGSCLQCESVVVGESEKDNAGATLIAKFLKYNFKSTLTKLILIDSRVCATGAAVLAKALLTNKTLETLELLGCNIGNDGAAAIAEMLKHNTTLRKVALRGNNIGRTGVSAIAEALKVNRILSHLDLAGNDIHCDYDDSAAAAVVEALDVNEALERLIVSFYGSSFHLILPTKHRHRVDNYVAPCSCNTDDE